MKKIKLLFLTILFILSGCSLFKNKQDDSDMLEYDAYYKSIIENENFKSDSKYYSINAELIQLENGKYSYYISIDNPKIAMYDIKILAIDRNIDYTYGNIIGASIGIFSDKTYSLIPFQVYKENGYYKGLLLNGETENSEVEIELLINWYNNERNKSFREFISFTLNKDGILSQHDNIEGSN